VAPRCERPIPTLRCLHKVAEVDEAAVVHSIEDAEARREG